MAYEVSTPVFEGPFDLLLHLITSEQVDLYEVSISRIVDAFLAELDRMEGLDLEVATEFLLIAATLVDLKCRRLLPGRDELEMDEELVLWEERDLLLSRLLECKTFKDAAQAFVGMMSDAARSVPRLAGPDERFADLAPDLLEGLSVGDLSSAFQRITAPQPQPKVDMAHVAPIRASVAETLAEVAERLRAGGPQTFRSLTEHLVERLEVIVRFLAVLELFKQGLVDLDQGETFGELHLLWVGGDNAAVSLDISSDLPTPLPAEPGLASPKVETPGQ